MDEIKYEFLRDDLYFEEGDIATEREILNVYTQRGLDELIEMGTIIALE